MKNDWEKRLKTLKEMGHHLSLVAMETPQEPEITLGGHPVINFCSDNYLGLANDPRIVEAGIAAMRRFGAGVCASRVISANLSIYEELEQAVATWKGSEAALLFNTGYQANIGAISAIACDPQDIVFVDETSHPSTQDGLRLAAAKVEPFRHGNANHLEDLLGRFSQQPGNRLIVTETVFNTLGDICPLDDILSLADRFGALVYLDECHGVGVFGTEGQGLSPRPQPPHLITMGNFGKALGGYGAFVTGSALLKDYLVNYARPFLFSTAPPPAAVGAAIEAVKIVRAEPERRKKLWDNIDFFGSRLMAVHEPSQIFTLMTGSSEETLRAWSHLLDSGLYVQEIRPPIVPEDQCRLRITLTNGHSQHHLSRLLEAVSEYGKL